MEKEDIKSSNIEPIYIGKMIEEELHRQGRTVTWLGRMIHCDRRNVYDIFSRHSIDTDLLFKISMALQKDFFSYFTANFQMIDKQSFTPPTHTHAYARAALLV